MTSFRKRHLRPRAVDLSEQSFGRFISAAPFAAVWAM
jgi:hypothetical protein